MPYIQGYIFDIDHTLLNSDKAQIDAALWALEQFDIHRTYADILKEFDRATDDMFRVVMGNEAVDKKISLNQIAELATVKLHELLPTIKPYPKVYEILETIHKCGAKIGIASNNYNSIIKAMIDTFHWTPFISSFAGIDNFQIEQRKPHPAMLQKVINDFGLVASDCVMIGDSQYDMMAGQKAGCFTIALCTGNSNAADFGKISPNLILDSITQLYPLLPIDFHQTL
jgi:HAD superfamily hydrolase (TIGR01509 family)